MCWALNVWGVSNKDVLNPNQNVCDSNEDYILVLWPCSLIFVIVRPYFDIWLHDQHPANCTSLGFADVSASSAHARAEPDSPTDDMAVNVSHVYILLLFIINFISNAATERRFSDFKRCADEECSSKYLAFSSRELSGMMLPSIVKCTPHLIPV